MSGLVSLLVNTIGRWGYAGIFILMFLESSFFPFPSEVVMIPAGFLAYEGKMNLALAVIWGTLGSYSGALFNYFLAERLGRKFLVRYGRYFFINEMRLVKIERFFQRHGPISTFNGRLIPGLRQYISLPAGLGRMDLAKFSLCTILGAGIWTSILASLGFFIGKEKALVKRHLHIVNMWLIFLVVGVSVIYIYRFRKSSRERKNEE